MPQSLQELKNNMPKFLEEKLKKEYGADSSIPYKVMNKLGVMHGNKETKKGRLEEKKHEMAHKMRHSTQIKDKRGNILHY